MLELVAVIADNIALRVRNPEEPLPRGEVQWAKAIQRVLEGKSTDLIDIERTGLHELLEDLLSEQEEHVWALEETGEPLITHENIDPRGNNSFILGDHQGIDSQTSHMLDDHSIYRLSIGNTSYLSSHCVAAVISKFERMVE